MRTRSSWIWYWIIGAALAAGAGAQQYTTIIDNLPTCTGNRNGRIIAVSDATSDSDCTEGGATGEDRFVHPCICDTLNALGPYWKAVGGGAGSSGPADALAPAVVIEGTTADAFEGNFTFADPTSDWTWAFGAGGSVTVPGSITVPSTTSIGTSDNNAIQFHAGIDAIDFYTNGTHYVRLNNIGILEFGSGGHVLFGDSTGPGGSRDIGIARSSAGVLKFTNGSTGNGSYRLPPLASPPVTCGDANTLGVEYTDTSLARCFCDGTSWQVLNPLTVGVGTCS